LPSPLPWELHRLASNGVMLCVRNYQRWAWASPPRFPCPPRRPKTRAAPNLFEYLWRKIKYRWSSLSARESFARLSEELFAIVKGVDSKYRITFA